MSDPFGDDARAGGDADTVPPQQAAVEAAGDIAELLDQGGCQRDRAHGFQAEDEDRLPGRGDLGRQAEGTAVGGREQTRDDHRVGVQALDEAVGIGIVVVERFQDVRHDLRQRRQCAGSLQERCEIGRAHSASRRR